MVSVLAVLLRMMVLPPAVVFQQEYPTHVFVAQFFDESTMTI
jgi:hypothetical protein